MRCLPRPAYDAASFDPPAPVANVTLRNPATGAVCDDVPMLLDTGADVTVVQRTCVERSGVAAVPGRAYQVRGFDGATSLAPIVVLELRLQNRSYRGQFLVRDDRVGIVGRNVLNSLVLTLDGPHQEWHIA